MLSWHFITRAAYDAASTSDKSADKLFFLSDTHEIYKGTDLFTESVTFYETNVPTNPAAGRLYIESTTLEGRIYNTSTQNWSIVIKPVSSDISDNNNNPASTAAVKSYVDAAVATASSSEVTSLTWNNTTKTLTATKSNGNNVPVVITDLGVGLSFTDNGTNEEGVSTGTINLVDINGNVIGTGVNIDLERFIKSASFDAANNDIVLVFNDTTDPLRINVAALIDTYTVADTSSVDLTMDNKNITAAIKISEEAANIISLKDDGIYATIDLGTYMTKAAVTAAGDIATLDADGQVVDSGKAIGGATLDAAHSANVLATEAAVENVRSSLQLNIDGKIAKMDAGDADKVIVSTDDGQVSRSAVIIGSDEGFSYTEDQNGVLPDSNVLATERGVDEYTNIIIKPIIDAMNSFGGEAVFKSQLATVLPATSAAASNDIATSEVAIVSALEWKTTV